MGNVGYYNQNSEQFVQTTLNINMESLYQAFLVLLPNGGHILDLGCGSGRDTLAFKNKGYQVEALDYSKALVEKATALTGIPVRYQSFYHLNDHGIYDGIWACASLLHCERDRLTDVMQSILNALKVNGILITIEQLFDHSADVDHFFPHKLRECDIQKPINGVANLVLACPACNREQQGRFDRLPSVNLLKRFHIRNEYLITNHHPLRETLIAQTGLTEPAAGRGFYKMYINNCATLIVGGGEKWEPGMNGTSLF